MCWGHKDSFPFPTPPQAQNAPPKKINKLKNQQQQNTKNNSFMPSGPPKSTVSQKSKTAKASAQPLFQSSSLGSQRGGQLRSAALSSVTGILTRVCRNIRYGTCQIGRNFPSDCRSKELNIDALRDDTPFIWVIQGVAFGRHVTMFVKDSCDTSLRVGWRGKCALPTSEDGMAGSSDAEI